MELHHLAGRHNYPELAAPCPANDHRVLSDKMRRWPQHVLRNPTCNPEVRRDAVVRGVLDVVELIIDSQFGGDCSRFVDCLDRQLQTGAGN